MHGVGDFILHRRHHLLEVPDYHRAPTELFEYAGLLHLAERKEVVSDAEQFLAEFIGAEVTHVDVDVRSLGLIALQVDLFGDQPPAGARFSGQQHRIVIG